MTSFSTSLAGLREILESCLPKPRTTGPIRLHYVYEPMRQIGGDLIFVPLAQHNGDSVISAVVLDVTGHGIAAALTVNRIVGELERLFAENPQASPLDVLRSLNHYVYLTLARLGLYVTALCVRIDASNSRLEWASGGHPTGFVFCGDGSVRDLESTSPILGVHDGPEFDSEMHQAQFDAGDVLIAYTDGAAEARNERSGQLGTAGVRRLLAKVAGEGRTPGDWPAVVLRQVLDYRGAPPDDDTLVVAIFRPTTS